MAPKKNKQLRLAFISVFCFGLPACENEFDHPISEISYHSGSTDLSTYISVGDSLTAGFADGALYRSGQESSFPAILAQQFSQVGGGEFIQPLTHDNLGGLLINGQTDYEHFPTRLVFNGTSQSPEPISGIPSTEVLSNTLTGYFNNMGVPGAKSFHLISPGYGNADGLALEKSNPYFVRFASSAEARIVDDAIAQQSSFFTLWIGNNDILSYATDGGTGVDQNKENNVDPETYASKDITHPALFQQTYQALVSALLASGGKGVLINIPDISLIPYFTTVPYNPVPLDESTAGKLNAAYTDYNDVIQDALANNLITDKEASVRTIHFSAGQNAVVIKDEALTDFGAPLIRQTSSTDLLLLPVSSKIGTAKDNEPTQIWGLSLALDDADVLTPTEISAIETARSAYNNTIRQAAEADENLRLVDSEILLKNVQAGFSYGTGLVDAKYASGGAFSLDGIHLTARGNAIVANTIIAEINTGFGAKLPSVDPGAYTTIFIK